MALLKVAQMGNPVLRERARELSLDEIRDPRIQALIDDMVETMREHEGVGLAAPQVHLSVRIAVVEALDIPDEASGGSFPLTVLVNPEIVSASGEKLLGWEGCLSIEGIRGVVPRFSDVEVRALDRRGEELRFEAKDFRARAIQHELDHLDGILFPDRMEDLRTLTFTREFHRYWAPPEEEP
jgi:peptide deformylase